MATQEYAMEEKKIDWILILFIFFLGWFGIDKFYATKSWKKGWKYALVKFLYNIILIGILWNIFDLIQAFRGKYQIDFRDYFE